jgi:hypothetical protein
MIALTVLVAISDVAVADTFVETYGGSTTRTVQVAPGTHTFVVDTPILITKNTEWYLTYSGGSPVETDSSAISDPQYTRSFTPGTYWVRAEVYDSSWNWEEAHRWQVVVSEPPPPDFIVQMVWTEPASPVLGEGFVIKATILNQGSGSDLLTPQQCRFYLASSLVSSVGYVGPGAGGTVTLNSGTQTVATAGTYGIRAVADATSQVVESNEGNNEYTGSVTVQQGPALWLSTDALSFGYTTNGQSFNIRNSGSGTLFFTNVTDKAWLYVDPIEGVSTGQTVTAAVFVDCSGLLIGTTSGVVTVFSDVGTSNVVVTVTISDADGDQIPDGWEIENFGSAAACNPLLDWDDDGVNNRDEWIGGSLPKDAGSRFGVSGIASQGNNGLIRVEWPTMPGRLYDIYWAQHLEDTFQLLGGNLPDTPNYYLDSMTEPSGFYKVNVRLANP